MDTESFGGQCDSCWMGGPTPYVFT
jgi:hypothetical protein